MMKTILLFGLQFVAISVLAQKHLVTPLFSLKEERAIVEGMTFDPVEKIFYFGNSVDKRILKYSLYGKRNGVIGDSTDGITSMLGMTVDTRKHHLWLCGAMKVNDRQIMAVFRYDLRTGKLLQRYPDTSGTAKLFNDVTITNNGTVFVTDSYERSIYKVDEEGKSCNLFVKSDSLRDSNGITTDGEQLFVSTYPGITKVDVKTKSIAKLRLKDFHIAGSDGLYYYDNSVIGIQNVFYPPAVVRYHFNAEKTSIVKAEVLTAAHPSFTVPTTGAVAGKVLFMMANNNIGREGEQKLDKITMVKIAL